MSTLPRRPTYIAVVGGGSPPPRALELAEQVGRDLAKRGAGVVCGGLGGVMEAVCRGAKAEGGTTIGILPGNDPQEANPYVDVPICTGMGYARNVIVVKTASAVIAIDGAYGTLSEIGHALGDGIPVVGLETWQLSSNGVGDNGIINASDPADAVEKALAAARRRERLKQAAAH
ncbi:MAG: TIGR00725 family protein [Chloroflexi bacterium]|nr:TIGR00725 family protein [Chloroflexota bacterium]